MHNVSKTAAMLCIVVVAGAGTAEGQAKDATALARMLGCRTIADAAARLACYDGRAGDVDAAIAHRDLVVADRAEVTRTRRSLFGLALPRIPLLEGRPGEAREPTPERLETTIVSASRTNDRWTLVLAEAGRWEQVDPGREADEPRAGMKISIRPAAFGTYFARIGAGTSLRIKRVG